MTSPGPPRVLVRRKEKAGKEKKESDLPSREVVGPVVREWTLVPSCFHHLLTA